jgi:hypothetical protein
MPKFPIVSCSQCGTEFGAGDHGYSYCRHHRLVAAIIAASDHATAQRVLDDIRNDASRSASCFDTQ